MVLKLAVFSTFALVLLQCWLWDIVHCNKVKQCIPTRYATPDDYTTCPSRPSVVKHALEWGRRNGIDDSNVESILPGEHNAGYVCARNLPAGSTVLAVPEHLFMRASLVGNYLPFDFDMLLEGLEDYIEKDEVILATFVSELLALVQHRRRNPFFASSQSQTADFSVFSFWQPWADALPVGDSYIEEFSKDDLEVTQDLNLVQRAANTIANWQMLYSRMCSDSSAKNYCDRVSEHTLVRTAVRAYDSRVFGYSRGETDDSALIPTLDNLNHATDEEATLDYFFDKKLGSFVAVARVGCVRHGAELTINYGTNDNVHLLKQYGFSLSLNKEDALPLAVQANDMLHMVGWAHSPNAKVRCELRIFPLESMRPPCINVWRLYHMEDIHLKPQSNNSIISIENEVHAVRSMLVMLVRSDSKRTWNRKRIERKLRDTSISRNVRNVMYAYAGQRSITWVLKVMYQLASETLLPIAAKTPSLVGGRKWKEAITSSIAQVRREKMASWETPHVEGYRKLLLMYASKLEFFVKNDLRVRDALSQ